MIRILAFLVAVVAIVATVTWLVGVDGVTTFRWRDTVISGQSSAFIGAAIVATAVVIIATLGVSKLARLPSSIRRRRVEQRQSRGMLALTRGLEAVAAGDTADAQRHARIAARHLGESPGLSRLLTAQAAQLAGDEETAEAAFAAMLEAPETEFLGLRGLYLQAMASGDRKEAREYAERAFRLRPGTAWAYQSVYALNIDRGAWGDAREALLTAQNHGLEGGDGANRREAALLTAMAYGADAAGDTDTALRDAEEALRKSPGFAPAAVLAARLEGQAGRRSKAGRILDDAWTVMPHPAIAKTMDDLFRNETIDRRTARLRKLAERRPEVDESHIVIAEQEVVEGDYKEARRLLEPILTRKPRARAFAAMAAATEGLYGRDAAQIWKDRAAAAPLDPVPGAEGVFNFTTDGWQRLIREFGEFGRLAPPPLEEVRTSLSAEEVRLLLAPPAPLTDAAIPAESEPIPAAITPVEAITEAADEKTANTLSAVDQSVRDAGPGVEDPLADQRALEDDTAPEDPASAETSIPPDRKTALADDRGETGNTAVSPPAKVVEPSRPAEAAPLQDNEGSIGPSRPPVPSVEEKTG